MKTTGIIRRVDDLGRVVIPKEIRRNLCIKENDALEYFVSKDGFIGLKKYDPCSSYREQVARIAHDMLGDNGLPPEIQKAAVQKAGELAALLGAKETQV